MFSNPVLGFDVLKYSKTTAVGCLSVNPKSNYLRKKYDKVFPISIIDYYDSNPKNIREYIIKEADWYYDKKKELVEDIHKLKLDRILPKIDLSVFDEKK